MALVKWSNNRLPWTLGSLANFIDTDEFFKMDPSFVNKELPAMNVKEREASFEVELAVPGFSKEEIEITIDDNILCVKGENSSEQDTTEDDYTRREFSSSSFERRMQLPKVVDHQDGITADYKNGVLKIELNKKQEAIDQPRKIIAIN